MAQQMTSPSNCSESENALRFNGSNSLVSPTESNFNSDFKSNLLFFEQFQEEGGAEKNPQAGKKKLTIRIDESYDFDNNQSEANNSRAFQKSGAVYGQSAATPMSGFELISPIENRDSGKYYQLLKEMQEIENNLQAEQEKAKLLEQECQQKDEDMRKLRCEVEQMRFILKSKDQTIQYQNELIEQNKREHDEELKDRDEKIRERDHKMKELSKMNIKLKDLSKDLLREVKSNQSKVKDLEKELQRFMCQATQDNINKLKESSLKLSYKDPYKETNKTSMSLTNKQNSFAVNSSSGMMRKSLEKKKATGTSSGVLPQPKKVHRASSSSSSTTILSKKLMHK